MALWMQSLVTILVSVTASSGFWVWLQKKTEAKGATTKLLLAIARDRIIFLGMSYVDRGWVSKDEFDDYINYLYEPYSKFGGNGLADKVVESVRLLPIKRYSTKIEYFKVLDNIDGSE